MENLLVLNVPICHVGHDGVLDVRLETSYRPAVLSEEMKNNLKATTEKYSPKIGDKLFFMPGVNIPRVKLKQLVLDYNIKIVKDPKEATAVFGNKHSVSKIVKSTWYHTIPVENFKECFTLLEPLLDNKDIASINLALDNYSGSKVYSDWSSIYNFCSEDLPPYKNQIVNAGSAAQLHRSSCYVDIVEEQYVEMITDLQNIPIFNESELIGELNGDDAILITEEVFEQLSEMFKSSDNDNHVIAMEIMANSRYKESLLFIHLLFKEFYHKMADSRTKDHVNFKSLLSYLQKDRYTLQSTLDSIVKSMMDKGVLTVEAVNYLLTKYSGEVLSKGDSAVFKVKNITLSYEILATLNNNYVFNIYSDFTPKVIEEVEEVEEIKAENLQWL